nr:transposase [Paludisphaera rhizosphaerae]
MIEAIEAARDSHRFHLWAYVLMPEHVHLLIYPITTEYSIGAVLTSLKQPVAKRALLFVRQNAPDFLPRMLDRQPNGKESHRFWQRGGGYDRNAWEPRSVWEMIDYIHANPVRRGLCDRPEDWEWSSASGYMGSESPRLRLDLSSLPEDPRR